MNNNEPAFPVSTRYDAERKEWGHQDGDRTFQCPGMTLRDYFAAKAMQALLSNPHREGTFVEYAQDAFEYADAMLGARK